MCEVDRSCREGSADDKIWKRLVSLSVTRIVLMWDSEQASKQGAGECGRRCCKPRARCERPIARDGG